MSDAPARYEGRGLRLTADTWGERGSPVVVLLHGGGQTRHAWRNTGEHFATAGYRVVSLDLRGHGDSDWAHDADYSMDAMVEDLSRVLDVEGRPAALVGASMGGIVSLLLAGEQGEASVSALVLVDIVPRIEPEGSARVRAFMAANPEGFASLDEAADAVAAYVPGRPRPKDPSGLAKNLRLGADGRWRWHWDPAFLGDIERRSAAVQHLNQTTLQDAARALSVPTLVVRGGSSDVVSEEGVQEFLQLAPHSEYVNVADASHMVAGDRNDVFAAAAVEFLGRVVPPSGGDTRR